MKVAKPAVRISSACLLIFTLNFCGLEPSKAEESAVIKQDLPEDLTEIGLKQLLGFDLTVTSPGKKTQAVSKVSSAIYVLTGEDIHRSGVTHVAEALRLVPGVDVARVSSSQWAVSVRGFNQVFANKLLVLIDGVSVFSPLTNGVYWETLDPILDDIQQIEVIRGPGAALWGANAVNGVINIITKSAKDTEGGLISVGGGTHDRGFGIARYGSKLSESTHARISGKFTDRTENRLASGSGDASDDWEIGSIDGRLDSQLDDGAALSLFGHAFSQQHEFQPATPSLNPPFVDTETFKGAAHWKGGYGAAKYQKDYSSDSSLTLMSSVLYQQLDSRLSDTKYSVLELDAAHRLSPIEGHDFMYGGSFRLFHNKAEGTFAQDTVPSSRTMYRANLFLQDEIALNGEELHLIIGSKFEQNVSTGFEYMPNVRLVEKLDEKNTLWGAVSRAVATPSLVFEDVRFPAAAFPSQDGGPTNLVSVFGDRGVTSEDLLAYEIGYRSEINSKLSLDFAGFFNDYGNILTQEPAMPYFGNLRGQDQGTVIIPLQFANGIEAESMGGELSAEWRAAEYLRLVGGYSYIKINARQKQSQDQDEVAFTEGNTPKHSVILRSLIDLPYDFSLDLSGRYVSRLSQSSIPDYLEANARIGWKPTKELELSIVGQNLLNTAHTEFVGNLFGPPRIEIERAYYGQVSWRF